MPYFKTAWLIDDDETFNFLTAKIIKLNDFCSETRSFTKAQEALAALEATVEKGSFPDFIFLDLNMPVLDGWGFLHAYKKFPEELKETCTLYILTSSIHENDVKRAAMNEEVRDFFTKPLTTMHLKTIKFQKEI